MQMLGNKTGITFFVFALVLSALALLLFKLALHSWRIKRNVIDQSIVGLIGRTESDVSSAGTVFVRGELWPACSSKPIKKGERVRVVGYYQLMLEIEKEEQSG